MICSDGLYNALSDDDIIYCLNKENSLENKVFDLIEMANNNAAEEALRVTTQNERLNGSVVLLGKMLFSSSFTFSEMRTHFLIKMNERCLCDTSLSFF